MPDGGVSLRWVSPGPVASRFMARAGRVQAIMGPVGSGKTSTVLMKLVKLAQDQAASPLDGVRRFKACVVRDTYRQLWATTIASWHKWVPPTTGTWVGASGGPAVHTIRFGLPDGTVAELIVEFVAIGDNRVEDVLGGYEPTAFYLNEAHLLSRDVFTFARGRVGRYPNMLHGGPTWYGTLLDLNAPDTENWIYKDFIDAAEPVGSFDRQPGGRAPGAENLANLPPGYYDELGKGQPDWWARRFIDNEFGYSRDGLPVFAEYRDAIHCAGEPLAALPKIPLVIGLDAGLFPAAIVLQRTPFGQWRALDELIGEGIGAERFGGALNRLLAERYPGLPAVGWADPSAAARVAGAAEERSWIATVAATSRLKIRPAPTNALIKRLDIVRQCLNRLIDGQPGYLISPRCRVLRKGFNADYQFKRMRIAGSDRYEELPAKNAASHPHDANQYALLGGGEKLEVEERARRGANPRGRQIAAADDLNPEGVFDRTGFET